MKTLVVNDLHLGVQRTGGTTLASAAELRDYAMGQYRELLGRATNEGCEHILVNGDLADTYDISLMQALDLYEVTDTFMSTYRDTSITWGLGNHDLSKNSMNLGTVAFIGALLCMKYPDRFTLMDAPGPVTSDSYLIPHVPNQDLFDLELEKVPDGVKWLFLHVNYDNRFACEASHSLNLDREQAKALKKRGITMVLGHEHQGREVLGGSVIIVGNQFPTSIADCLSHGDAQTWGTKRAMVIDHESATHKFVDTWSPTMSTGWFERIDWRDLKDVQEEGQGFIRVEGTALAAEAADVIKEISAFRQRSKSFVVTNAVQIEKVDGLGDIADSIEDVRSVDILEMLYEMLDEKQQAAVKALYGEEK